MALRITCPNCGSRPFTEFWCGGELGDPAPSPAAPTDPDSEFSRIWLRRNTTGLQRERWFHHAGCRRWLTVHRDTRDNSIHGVD